MAANLPLQPIDDQGWRAGLGNLLRKELHDWWGTRKWWTQILIWLVILNGMLVVAFWSPEAAAAAGEGASEQPGDIFAIFGGIFGPIGVIVLAQSRIIGDKQLGTAAWLLSKPLSRSAYLLSKLLADGVGILITMLGVQALVAYAQFSVFTGTPFPVLQFLTAMSLLALNLLVYLAVTLMLGTFFSGRSAVIGGALVLLFIQSQLGQSSLAPYVPGALPFMAIEVLGGRSLPSILPTIIAALLIVVCMGVALWRFNREEF